MPNHLYAGSSMKGAVAAGHPLTAQTAAEVLRSGGNAFDAAIAGFFTACICEPVLASPGGGGFLLARQSRGDSRLYDFFTHTPGSRELQARLDFEPVTVDFGTVQQDFHIGWGTCAVPGAVAGMFTAHRELGRIPMRELVQPAVELAKEGVLINDFQASLFVVVAPIYRTESAFPLFRSTTHPDKLVQPGDQFSNPDLGDFIDVLSREGSDLFYRGELAQLIVDNCRDRGGYLSYRDLENYSVITREPLKVEYRNHRLTTNPAPGAGGLLIGFGLGLLERMEFEPGGFGSAHHLRALVETLLRTTEARGRCFTEGPNESLLDPEFLSSYRDQVRDCVRAYRGTTHISVIDAAGNAASLSLSNGEGCGHLLPATGFMLNNMLGEEDVNPGGFHTWATDERMSSMMAPSVLESAQGTITALGSGGSNRIRTAILQVLVNLVEFGMPLDQAVTCPRIHIEKQALRLERGFSESLVASLLADYPDHHVFEEPNMFFGGVHTTQRLANGDFSAAGDPRRGGVGLVVD